MNFSIHRGTSRASAHPQRCARVFCLAALWRRLAACACLVVGTTLAQAACLGAGPALQQVLSGIAVAHGLWPAATPEGQPRWATSVVLWQGQQAVVLDPGPSLCSGRQLHRAMDTLAGAPMEVALVLLSHAHAEQALASSAWDAPIAALPGTQAAMQQRCADCMAALAQDLGAELLQGTRSVQAQRLLHDGQWLHAAGRWWQVLEVPMAHTESDLLLWAPADGVLLAGGLLDGRALVLGRGRLTGWLAALERIEALQVRWLIGQHLVAGPAQVSHAIARQRQALCLLVQQSWQGLEIWQTPAEVLAALPAGLADDPWHVRNLQRAWREMEALWLGRETLPAACMRQAQTSGGN